MAGGLINLASYAVKDIFLTGNPQISFYKSVYRRYTHFAMESIILNFDKAVKFGEYTQIVVPKNGDLIHKSYLHITLPQINITKKDVGINTSYLTNYLLSNSLNTYNEICNVYMLVNTNIYKIIYADTNAINVSWVNMKTNITNYYNGTLIIPPTLTPIPTTISTYSSTKKTGKFSISSIITYFRNIITDYDDVDLYYIFTNFDTNIKPQMIIDLTAQHPSMSEIDKDNIIKKYFLDYVASKGIKNCIKLQDEYYEKYLTIEKENKIITDTNIKCAWVKNLGHSIIDYIDIYIGGQKIDSHLGIWINIWYQLTYKEAQIDTYNKLIGNVSDLTDFNNNTKPVYDIYVPMSFWFNKFNGLSFPLIASQYNDLRIDVKLRKFEDVFYIERIYNTTINHNEYNVTAEMIGFIKKNIPSFTLTNTQIINNINLTNLWNSSGYMLYGDIWMDYIFLDSLERKRFAQSGHEYLVEIIQTKTQDYFDLNANLYFICPSKELIWVITHDKYTNNTNGYTECKWYDHSLNKNNTIYNPILTSQLYFNNIARNSQLDGTYYDIYQPQVYHKVSPTRGINLYSFSLEPLQMQPTGTCNFSKLTDVRITMSLDNQCYSYCDVDIYSHDLNIDTNIIIFKEDIYSNLDIATARQMIKMYSSDTDNYKKGIATLDVYDYMANNNEQTILLSKYRQILLKTNVNFYVFNLSLNVLRIIGGYCSLAYASKN